MHNLIFYDCNLKGKKLKVFYEFIKKYCNIFSIESYFNGKLTNTEIKDIQNELSGHFKHEDQECRKRYKMDSSYRHTLESGLDIKTEAQVDRYFNKVYKENMATVEMCDFKVATDHIDYLPFIDQGYLGNRVTRIGTNSLGCIYNILYYDICMFDVVTEKMNDLCGCIDIGQEQFWDLSFYHDKELIFRIYTDDKEAYGYFNDDIYRDFKRLNIPFSFEEEM